MSKKIIINKEEIPARVDEILGRAAKHEYPASLIYAVHNAVFELNKPVKLCATCLRNRVRDLKRWRAENPDQPAKVAETRQEGPAVDPNRPEYLAPDPGATRYSGTLEGNAIVVDVLENGKLRPAQMLGGKTPVILKGATVIVNEGQDYVRDIKTDSKGKATIGEPYAPGQGESDPATDSDAEGLI